MEANHIPSKDTGGALSGRRLLDCGIECNRLVSWLDEELALPQGEDGSWTFFGSAAARESTTCRITVKALPKRCMGSMALPHTSVSIEGDEEAREEFLRLFTLRFISAGG